MSFYIFFVFIFIINLWVQRKAGSLMDAFKKSMQVSIVVIFLFQVVAYLYSGYIDPFIIIAIFIQFTMAVVIGYIVGVGYIQINKSE